MTMPAEAPARREGNILKRKIGPLPTWVWVLIVAGIILAWALVRRSSSSQQTASPAGPDQSQVPQFVNQTFVQPGPPGAPDEDTGSDDDDDGKKRPGPPVNLPPVPPRNAGGPPGRKTSGPPTRHRPPQKHKRRKRHVALPGK